MPRLLLALTATVFACKTAPTVAPHDPVAEPSGFARHADELETTAQPIWPTLPAALTADLQKSAGAAADPAAALAAAKQRLDGWTLDVSSLPPDAVGAKLRAALEGLYLAEPLAYGDVHAKQTGEAAGLLHHIYDLLDASSFREWIKAAPNIGLDRKLLEVLADQAPAQRKHLGAVVMRSGGPLEAVAGVLRDVAERARADGNLVKSRDTLKELDGYLEKRITFDDWIDRAAAEMRVDDRAAAAAALEQARKLPVPNRLGSAKVRESAKDLARLDRLLALAKDPSVDARLERLDLLRNLGRTKEAEALLAALKKDAPTDARVRVRSAAFAFEGMAQAGNMIEAAGFVAQELGDDSLVNKDADYWSMLIGAQGAHAMAEALPELFKDRVAGGKKMVEIVKTMRGMAVELEKTRPGRAAALEYVLDRAVPIILQASRQDLAVAELLKGGLDDAIALRAKYPETTDLDRLVFTFATFTVDREKALAAVMHRPATPPEDDVELYQSRARSALTLAIVIAKPAAIQSARTAIEDIAPSWSTQIEANREAMLGDVDALQATVTTDAALWATAAKHYETARTMHKEVRARVTNNLGWIALQAGNLPAADALFRESAEGESGRRWVAFLNALATPLRANERLEGLRSLILANSSDGKPPNALLIWLAATTPDPKEAGDAAQKVIDDRKDPFTAIKPAVGELGFETEGAFQVGLGLASRKFYELNTQAYASLWLMPRLPLDDQALAVKAKAVATPAAKPPKPPKKK